MPEFDPYHKWLGISPQHQPPNHYRLLSLDLYESDPEVIEASVDRIAAFLQDVATGPHARDSQQLLNEIAAARLCLLNESQRTAYDAQLQAELSSNVEPPTIDNPPAPPPVPAITIDTGDASGARKSTQPRAAAPSTVKRTSAARKTTRGKSKNKSPLLLLSYVSAAGLILAIVIYAMLPSSESRRRAEEEERIRERYDSFARMGEGESSLPDFKANYDANTKPPPKKQKRRKQRKAK